MLVTDICLETHSVSQHLSHTGHPVYPRQRVAVQTLQYSISEFCSTQPSLLSEKKVSNCSYKLYAYIVIFCMQNSLHACKHALNDHMHKSGVRVQQEDSPRHNTTFRCIFGKQSTYASKLLLKSGRFVQPSSSSDRTLEGASQEPIWHKLSRYLLR